MKPYLTCVHFQNSNNSWPVFSPKSSIELLSKVNRILVYRKMNIWKPKMNALYYFFYFDEGTFLIFLSWLSRSEEQKTAPRKPAPTNNGDPGGNKIAFALKSNSHWWFMKQKITMANTDEVVVKQYISQERLGLETECRRAPRRFFSLQIVWQFLFLKKDKL